MQAVALMALSVTIAATARAGEFEREMNVQRATFLENAAGAIELAAKCPSWQINGEMVLQGLTVLGLNRQDLDGALSIAYRGKWHARAINLGSQACQFAESAFGPNGNVVPGLMLPAVCAVQPRPILKP